MQQKRSKLSTLIISDAGVNAKTNVNCKEIYRTVLQTCSSSTSDLVITLCGAFEFLIVLNNASSSTWSKKVSYYCGEIHSHARSFLSGVSLVHIQNCPYGNEKKTSRICPADDDHNSWSPTHPTTTANMNLSVVRNISNIFGIFTARKRSLGQGYMFTGVCLSTGGGCLVGGMPGPGGLLWGDACSGGMPAPRGPARGGGACSQGCLLWWGGAPRGCLMETPPGWPLLRAVRIPLECILVIKRNCNVFFQLRLVPFLWIRKNSLQSCIYENGLRRLAASWIPLV